MPAKLRKRHNPEIVLREISRTAQINKSGAVSFGGFAFDEHLASLVAMIDFGESADWQSCEVAVQRAISAAIRGKSYDANTFVTRINEYLHAERARPLTSYCLLTSISIAWSGLPFKSIRHRDCTVRFHRTFPARFRSRHRKESESHLGDTATPDGYTAVVVSTKARSMAEAADKGIRVIQLVRALLCFRLNYAMQSHFGLPSAPRTRNKISLGRLYTVHESTGDSPGEMYWYDSFDGLAPVLKPLGGRKQAVLRKMTFAMLRRLKASRYGDDIETALIRYVHAFDEPEDNEAIPKLWTVLEKITAISATDYDALVRRASAVCVDVPLHAQHLAALRQIRNGIVHEGTRSRNSLTHCYQLQSYFRRLVFFHVRHALDYPSLAEANAFLDLSPDIGTLKAQQAELRKAIRYHTPRKPAEP